MLRTYYFLLNLTMVVSCGPMEIVENNQANINSLSESEIDQVNKRNQLQKMIDEDLKTTDSQGNLTSLKGFSKSSNLDESSSDQQLREMYASDDQVFEFIPPEGVTAEFSEPVMVTSANLALTNKSSKCSNLEYFEEELGYKETINSAHQKNICGSITANFCIRMLPVGFVGDKKETSYVYTETPSFTFSIPCKNESFKDISISIANGKESTEKSIEPITIKAIYSVSDIYLTNDSSCSNAGAWEPITSESIERKLDFLDGKATVYAKFRDIFGQESDCISDSISKELELDIEKDNSIIEEISEVQSIDITPPSKPSGLGHGSYSYTNASPQISWDESSDVSSGVEYYEVSLGSSLGGVDIRNWERFDGNSGTIENLNIDLGSTYYVNVRAVDYAGNVSEANSSGGGVIVVEDKISSNCSYRLGKLKCWGENSNGQLGQGHTDDIGDEPGEMGENLLPIDLGTNQYIKQISGSCVLFQDGRIKCWGYGLEGALGHGNTDNIGDDPGEMGNNLPYIDLGTERTAKMIASSGGSHACAILDNDSVKCWGENEYGGLGYGHSNNIGDEPGEMGDNLPEVNLGTGRSAKYIEIGSQFTCVILDNDSVKCWGKGGAGRLGQGSTAHIGDGPGEMGDNLPAIDLGTGRTAKKLSAHNYSVCAVLDNDSVKCWGNGVSGGLGQGSTAHIGDGPGEMGDNLPAIDLGTGRTVKQIARGRDFTCAILDNDSVKCWGVGERIGLGDGTVNIGDDPGEMGNNLPIVDLGTGLKAIQIYSRQWNTCAMFDNNLVKCWGGHVNYSEFGSGDTEVLGDDPGEMGDSLLPLDLW